MASPNYLFLDTKYFPLNLEPIHYFVLIFRSQSHLCDISKLQKIPSVSGHRVADVLVRIHFRYIGKTEFPLLIKHYLLKTFVR